MAAIIACTEYATYANGVHSGRWNAALHAIERVVVGGGGGRHSSITQPEAAVADYLTVTCVYCSFFFANCEPMVAIRSYHLSASLYLMAFLSESSRPWNSAIP